MIVDAPGYGARGRPEWGRLFEYYIRNRKEWVSSPLCLHILLSMSLCDQALSRLCAH